MCVLLKNIFKYKFILKTMLWIYMTNFLSPIHSCDIVSQYERRSLTALVFYFCETIIRTVVG